MASLARQRGIEVVEGVAEALPFQDGSFDFVLMVTVICFLNDVEKALSEACRVLKPGGCIIIAFIDKNSPIGKTYEQYKNENVFYKEATFYSVEDVTGLLQSAGFKNLSFCQTVFNIPQRTNKWKNRSLVTARDHLLLSGQKNNLSCLQ